ncbi:hypothetical protein C8R48DRAFT_674414 [Suillus tomentosus]|nr:hypothetical protein C8R48DRAFT_674414 [Suillus tomentosus]
MPKRLGEKGQESKTYTNDTGMMIFWAAAAQLVTFLLGHESGGIRVVIDHRRLTTGILASGHLLVIETHQRGRHLRVSKSGQGGSKTDSIVITSLMARAPANLRVERLLYSWMLSGYGARVIEIESTIAVTVFGYYGYAGVRQHVCVPRSLWINQPVVRIYVPLMCTLYRDPTRKYSKIKSHRNTNFAADTMAQSHTNSQTTTTQTTTVWGVTDISHESESPESVPNTLQRANKEKRTHCTSGTQHGGVALNGNCWKFAKVVKGKTQVWKDVNETMKKGYFFNASYVTPTVMEPDERKESESMKTEPNQSGGEVIVQTSISRTWVNAHQTRKRKIGDADGNEDTDKENCDVTPKSALVVKRICREKTGTDWQTVLDIIKYGDEQREKRKFDDKERVKQ